MAETKPSSQTMNVSPNHVKVDQQGHVTISDPNISKLLEQKAGAKPGHDLSAAKSHIRIGIIIEF